jgi:hypothetical protein
MAPQTGAIVVIILAVCPFLLFINGKMGQLRVKTSVATPIWGWHDFC